MIYKWNVEELNFVQYIPQEIYEQAALILLVNVGANSDGEKMGISHYVEHMLVTKLTYFFYAKNINFIATTYREHTTYEILCKNNTKDILEYIALLLDIYKGKYLTESIFEDVREDIVSEFKQIITTSKYKRVMNLARYDNNIGDMAIGRMQVIKSLQYPEILNFHKENYLNMKITIGIVTNLDIKTKFNTKKIEKPKIEILPKKYVKNPKGILFSEDSKCLIYQKELYCNNSHRARFVEDLSTAIIETIIYREFDINISFYKTYYGKQNKYWIAYVNCNIEEFYKIIGNGKNMIDNLSNKDIMQYREEYMKELKYMNLSIEFYINELLYHLVYAIPVYEKDVYKKMNAMVSNGEILREISYRIANYDTNLIIEK